MNESGDGEKNEILDKPPLLKEEEQNYDNDSSIYDKNFKDKVEEKFQNRDSFGRSTLKGSIEIYDTDMGETPNSITKSSRISLNTRDFEIKKKSFCETNYIKKTIYIIIYIISYTICTIFIRVNSMDLNAGKASLIQGAIHVFLIPISFFASTFARIKKRKKNKGKDEKEIHHLEIEVNMRDNISDYMNKQYYEVYYSFTSKFYLLSVILSIIYYLSYLFFYLGFTYNNNPIQAIYAQFFYSIIPTIITIIKLFTRGVKLRSISLITIFSNIIIVALFFLSFIIYNKNGFNIDDVLSSIYLGIYLLLNTSFIYGFKFIFREYFYYIDILEFVGYIGLYILVVVPGLLFLAFYLLNDGSGNEFLANNPQGPILFSTLLKSIFSSCICDLSFIYILKYFSFGIITKIININLGIIYFIYYLFVAEKKLDILLFAGEGFVGLSVVLLIIHISLKNFKKIDKDFEKQQLQLRYSM